MLRVRVRKFEIVFMCIYLYVFLFKNRVNIYIVFDIGFIFCILFVVILGNRIVYMVLWY